MQFSESWLRSLVNPELDTQQLGHLLTMAGLEVETIEPTAAHFSNVVVAKILVAEKHPDADRLQVCQVDVGEAQPLTIVCGAANARAGLITACARVGAKLPGIDIKQAKVRGVASFGMLCSAKELGINSAGGVDGILELPPDAKIGFDLRELLDLDDQIYTIKLTPNRGDCLSLSGIAREVAALTGTPSVEVDCTPVAAVLPDVHAISIAANSACPIYCGRVIRGIDPKAETPLWMVRRLERCGLRAIHPVVDITNYVLLELGQPMHGFDLARLNGTVQVRMASAGERLSLLNGQSVEFSASDEDILLIADGQSPLAMAGIMGGDASAVSEATRDIFLESAHFTPDAITGKARRFGLSTDSSHRFERGVDTSLPRRAMERATRLLLEICGGECGPVIEAGQGATAFDSVVFRPARARRLLGYDLDDARMRDILERLGMAVGGNGETFQITPPSYRFDISREVDLIEEVARVHGYEAVPAVSTCGVHAILPVSETARSQIGLKNILVARGFQEVITYSFISEEMDHDFRTSGVALPLLNPIASQMGVMRGSLVSGLIQTLRHNLNHGQERLQIFEIGRVFLGVAADQQPLRLAALAFGNVRAEQWGEKSRAVDFFDMRADLEALLHPVHPELKRVEIAALHPGQSAEILINGVRCGWLGTLHPQLTQKYGFTRSPILLEIDLAPLLSRHVPIYRSISRFHPVRRDIALVVDANLALADILTTVSAANIPLLAGIHCFDVYQGQGVEPDKKSLAFNMLLQHTEKTLTDSEIDSTVAEVVNILAKNHNAILRS
jgi:phenylalanyl-tRNA synthetase beta chain